MNYFQLIFFLVILSFILLLLFNSIGHKFKLLDLPSSRKIHSKPTPYIGGTMLGVIYLISIFFVEFTNNDYKFILLFSFIISLVGLLDDKINFGVTAKLIFQSLPILILIFNYNFVVTNLSNFGNYFLNLGSLSHIFTILCVYLLINATNYIDGIDGFASSIFISSFILIFIILPEKNIDIYQHTLITLIPIIIFILFNLSFFGLPKIFLGDSGSLLLGFMLSFTLISIFNNFEIHAAKLCWCVPIIVYDFLYVNLTRIKSKKNIFEPTTEHVQHMLLKKTKSIYYSNLIGSFINLSLGLFGFLIFEKLGEIFSIYLFILTFMFYFYLRLKFWRIN